MVVWYNQPDRWVFVSGTFAPVACWTIRDAVQTGIARFDDRKERSAMPRKLQGTALCSVVFMVTFALLYHRFHSALWYSLAITFGTIGYHFVMRLLVGLVYNVCMKNRADYSKPWYRQKSFEPRLYEKLRVKSWKEKMPTYESDLFNPRKHSWNEIAQAMCQAELVHETIVVLSFLPLAATYWFGSFPVFLITSALSALLDLTFVIMQRYNRPRVVHLVEKQNKKKEMSP